MKKVLISIIILCLLAFSGYYYMTHYYGTKNYGSADADYKVDALSLKKEFADNETKSTQKYTNKAVQVTGTVTELSASSINFEGVSCKLSAAAPSVKVGDKISMKGRLVGYDSLLEEVQLDQCSVVE